MVTNPALCNLRGMGLQAASRRQVAAQACKTARPSLLVLEF
jgi:hypothetical protein